MIKLNQNQFYKFIFPLFSHLICLDVSSHYITSLVCNQVQLQIIFSFKVFSTFGTLEPSKWMVSGVVSSEITHV